MTGLDPITSILATVGIAEIIALILQAIWIATSPAPLFGEHRELIDGAWDRLEGER